MSLVLYRGEPPWHEPDGVTPPPPPLAGDTEAEVAIIGAGITGALLAYRLARDGVDALVLDRRAPAMGSTFASTALLSYEMDVHLIDLIERIGDRDATRVYELGRAAIHRLRDIADDVGGRTGFAMRPAYYLARNEEDAEDLEREYRARAARGFALERLDPGAIQSEFSFARPLATRTAEAAEVDPVCLARQALAYAARRGTRIARETVIAWQPHRDGVRVTLASGRTVLARRIVFATGYETKEFLAIPEARLTSTYVVATHAVDRLPGWPERALICEAGDPYTYLRRMPDGRVMIGGADEDFADPVAMRAALPAKARKLIGMLRAMFPGADLAPRSAWAGVFSATVDGLPSVGTYPGQEGALFALGYGGNGITAAATAADIIGDKLSGRHNPDARLFRFGRGVTEM